MRKKMTEELIEIIKKVNGRTPNGSRGKTAIKSEIRQLQRATDLSLPDWYQDFLLNATFLDLRARIYGSQWPKDDLDFTYFHFLDIEDIIDEYAYFLRSNTAFPYKVLPFAGDNGGGDYYFIVLTDHYQDSFIIQIFHDEDNAYRVISNDIGLLFEQFDFD